MTDPWKTRDVTLTPDMAERVDAACDRFEAAWRENRPLTIDEVVGDTPEPERSALVRHLILLDVDYRRRRGETPRPEDYHQWYALLGLGWFAREFEGAAASPVFRYRLADELGHGGMGSVLRGYDPHLGRELAVKVLLEQHRGHTQVVRRFLEEARIGARLQHPGIVPVYDRGEFPDQRPFFTMKLVQGRTLADLLKERTQPDQDQARFLGIFEQVAQTMAYAHAHGVIHRDLKPSNVMVGAFGEVQVMDWGLAKVLAAEQRTGAESQATPLGAAPAAEPDAASKIETERGVVMGTYSHMPPEQAHGEIDRIDERSDVFGLGAILCEILTGRPPFTGKTREELSARAKACDHVEAFAALDHSGADADLVQLTKRCLAADRRERPRDAGEVAGAMMAYLTSVTERKRAAELAAVKATARAASERKARRLTIGLTAATLLLVVGGGGVAWRWQAQRTDTERTINPPLYKAEQLSEQAAGMPRRTSREAKDVLAVWRQAEAALGQAVTALNTGVAADSLRRRVAEMRSRIQEGCEQAERKEKLLRDLDDARISRAKLFTSGHDDSAQARYPAAFASYGLEVKPGRAEELARLIRAEEPAIREALIVALDVWAIVALGSPMEKELRAIAIAADDDVWRNRFRAADDECRNHDHAAVPADARETLLALSAEARQLTLPPSSLELLADALFLASEHDEGVSLLRWARDRHPTDFWIHLNLGSQLFMRKGRSPVELEESTGCYRVALALRPDVAVAYRSLGQNLHAKGQRDEAIDAYRKATELEPREWYAFDSLGDILAYYNRLDDAITAYRRAIELDPGTRVAMHDKLGRVLYDNNQPDEAIAAFRNVIDIDPQNADGYLKLGMALFRKNRLDEAIAAYRNAIKLEPRDSYAFELLGDALADENRLDEAITAYRQAIDLQPNNPKNPRINYPLRVVPPFWSDSLSDRHRRINNDRIYSALGRALCDNNQPDEAIAAFRKAIDLHPQNANGYLANSYLNLGVALFRKNRLDEGIAASRKAIEFDPKCAPAYCNLGNGLFRKNRLDEAVDAYRKAIELDRECLRAHQMLGFALMSKKEYEAAIECFRKVVTIDPKNATAHQYIGYNLKQTGHFTEAKACLQHALELFPPKDPGREVASLDLTDCDTLLALEGQLPDILAGKARPADPVDRVRLARICQSQRRYAAAAQFYSDAFADVVARLILADNLGNELRYNAACAAALAATGQGTDANKLNDHERARLRKQALDWLRADLSLWSERLENGKPEDRKALRDKLEQWQRDPDLAGVREPEALKKLSAEERGAWKSLWADVADLLQQAGNPG